MRVRARSRAVSSSTWAFSRRRGGRLLTDSPYEPLRAQLKERIEATKLLYRVLTRLSTTVSAREQRHELIDVHRLGDVGVKAGVERLTHVLGLAVTGQRDEPYAGQGGLGAQPARHLHAVDVGQPDVAQDDLGMQPLGRPYALAAVARRFHPGAFRL